MKMYCWLYTMKTGSVNVTLYHENNYTAAGCRPWQLAALTSRSENVNAHLSMEGMDWALNNKYQHCDTSLIRDTLPCASGTMMRSHSDEEESGHRRLFLPLVFPFCEASRHSLFSPLCVCVPSKGGLLSLNYWRKLLMFDSAGFIGGWKEGTLRK